MKTDNHSNSASERIIIARHGRPALDRMVGPKIDWQAYRKWWARYEAGGLAAGQTAPKALMDAVADCAKVLASERKRALETARSAAPFMAAEVNTAFNEAPLPPPRIGLKFLPRGWNILARISWLWGHSLDEESHSEAKARAHLAAKILIEAADTHGTVFLAAHGWFNRMIRPALKKNGWKCTYDGGDSYWSYRVYERR